MTPSNCGEQSTRHLFPIYAKHIQVMADTIDCTFAEYHTPYNDDRIGQHYEQKSD